MLIPMISFHSKVESLWTIPIAFSSIAEAEDLIPKSLKDNPADYFDAASLACEFNPETGEIFSVEQDITSEFKFFTQDIPAESEVSDEESPVEGTESEEVP